MASAEAEARGATVPAEDDQARPSGRRIGMRLWLGAAFGLVSLITASAVFIFVRDSSSRTLRDQAADLAAGRTSGLANELAFASRAETVEILAEASGPNFEAWVVGPKGPLPGSPPDLPSIARRQDAIDAALEGRSFRAALGDEVTVSSYPVFDEMGVRAAVLSRSTPSPALRRAVDDLRGDAVRALAIAIAIGVLVGFVVSSLISIRVKRLARSAETMASGRLDAPLPAEGGDEIGDLARSLDTMREALRASFAQLATERDRLSAIFDGLTEAVIVVGEEGTVRFSNPAAEKLVSEERPATALVPTLERAAESGSAETPFAHIAGRVYAAQARSVPAEQAVLMVVRDRTEELKREAAERDFVSNAAHELRNPLAGISGAIEVLQGGAKDDPEAREQFLARLAVDAERMTRLTQSLLALARVEAFGERDQPEVVDVTLAAREAADATEAPEGVELRAELTEDLVAEGDPVLVRQVLVGLLSNACKNTPAPGTVTLRAFRGEEFEVRVEVEDTGRGIPAEEQDRVFERFYRGSGAREGEGFGLGLSIAKRMVDVMGGRIGVKSVPDRGSTFWVQLREHQPTPTPVA